PLPNPPPQGGRERIERAPQIYDWLLGVRDHSLSRIRPGKFRISNSQDADDFETVIASVSEAIHSGLRDSGLLRRFASRNDV
ncbi:MAG: hypothetical protein ACLQDM_02740, partial [Bradyrhizobium sp.]